MGTTARGAPYPDGTDANDVPSDIQAIAQWTSDRPGIATMTDAERVALSGVELWDGRFVYATDTDRVWAYISGAWKLWEATGTWTPTLSAVTTNPTLGSGSIQQGRYRVSQGWLKAHVYVQFGSSGAAAGSGIYELDLPAGLTLWTAAALGIGRWTAYDNNANLAAAGEVAIASTTKVRLSYPATHPTGTPTNVRNSAPWTWANSDNIVAWFEGELA